MFRKPYQFAYEKTFYDKDFDKIHLLEAMSIFRKTVIIEAFEPGTTNITVYTDDGGFSASIIVNVTEKTVAAEGIYLDTGSVELYVGESKKVNENVYPSDATDKTVVWTSEDESIASVDASGNITAVSKGSTTITATTNDGGYVAMVLVITKSD